jgi:hypothetical protein
MEIAIIGGGIRWSTRTGFGNLDDVVSQEELRALSDRYKRVAGYSIEELGKPGPRTTPLRFVDGSAGL